MTIEKWQIIILLWAIVCINVTLKFRLRRDESFGYLVLSISRRKWLTKAIEADERRKNK